MHRHIILNFPHIPLPPLLQQLPTTVGLPPPSIIKLSVINILTTKDDDIYLILSIFLIYDLSSDPKNKSISFIYTIYENTLDF